MNKCFAVIFLCLVSFFVQTTNAHKDEIKIKIVHSTGFDSFVSNFGHNFNSFLVKLLKNSNFDNEPFYIQNLAFLFEHTDLVVKRTNYVGELVVTRTNDIFTKYFSTIDFNVCEDVFTDEFVSLNYMTGHYEQITTHILSNFAYIHHNICADLPVCFGEKILEIFDSMDPQLSKKLFDNEILISQYVTLFKSDNFNSIMSSFLEECVTQYVKFMISPTYNNFLLVIDDLFTNIENNFESQKDTINSLIFDFNTINKAMCKQMFDIKTLTAFDEHINKYVIKIDTV